MSFAARFPSTMLLAAGLGTRLRPLTNETPKPLVPLAGKPLIEHVIAAFRAEGAETFVVNTHYRAAQIKTHFAARDNVVVIEEDVLLGTGGGVRNALPALESEHIFIANTDAVWPLGNDRPLTRMQARHEDNRSAMTLLCAHPARATGFSRSHDFCLDPRGRVTRDSGLPVIYAGIALARRSLFEEMAPGPASLFPLMERALEEDQLSGVLLDAPWHHVGDPHGLALAEAAFS
ncbi:mannose-1-phosphate guanylyltransferase [Devosia pacifica]|uniref:Mannose-1-phosphate guanylyltransferase n=1 Tax=Devosia pacifica TaxID=1335967 RepID=A0A918S576_9HYPH|nr:nucleotidyltransferase family protein [Devosia pacifica]GHA21170.1 mannose-1-phosphate guanylyltransferase [Devosia pacifica]